MDNPYGMMLDAMQGEAGRRFWPGVRTGAVVSISPLTVRTGDILLEPEDLMVDPRLLPRDRAVSADGIVGSADLSVKDGAGARISNGTATMTAHLPGELAAGDRVALLTADNETFVVVCKVVAV